MQQTSPIHRTSVHKWQAAIIKCLLTTIKNPSYCPKSKVCCIQLCFEYSLSEENIIIFLILFRVIKWRIQRKRRVSNLTSSKLANFHYSTLSWSCQCNFFVINIKTNKPKKKLVYLASFQVFEDSNKSRNIFMVKCLKKFLFCGLFYVELELNCNLFEMTYWNMDKQIMIIIKSKRGGRGGRGGRGDRT